EEPPALRGRSTVIPRGGARPPPAERNRDGTWHRAAVPAFRWFHGVRRGLGTVFGAARPGGGFLHGPVFQLRSPLLRDVACTTTRSGYGHTLEGLVPPAGDRFHGGELRARASQHHRRSRSLHLMARPGARLQDGRAGDP